MSKNPISYVIGAALLFGAGYFTAKYKFTNNDISLVSRDDGLYLSYKQSVPRILENRAGSPTLGTLPQRLDDLLNEDPYKIRQVLRNSVSAPQSYSR